MKNLKAKAVCVMLSASMAAMGLTGLSRTTFYRLAHQYKNGGLGV